MEDGTEMVTPDPLLDISSNSEAPREDGACKQEEDK